MHSDKATAVDPGTYEDNLNRLRLIVDDLERGSLSLEDSLKLFEEGIKLSELCDGQLAAVEERVRVLITSKEQLAQASNASGLSRRKELELEICSLEGEEPE